jgi:hypothetical protein
VTGPTSPDDVIRVAEYILNGKREITVNVHNKPRTVAEVVERNLADVRGVVF